MTFVIIYSIAAFLWAAFLLKNFTKDMEIKMSQFNEALIMVQTNKRVSWITIMTVLTA